MGPKRGGVRSDRTAISSKSYSNLPPQNTALAASTYGGSSTYILPTAAGGPNTIHDYQQHMYDGHSMEHCDTWDTSSIYQLSRPLYTNQVIPSSSSVPTDDMFYSQTPLGYGRMESSPADAVANTLPLEVGNISVQRRADKKCTWPGCGKAFQTATHLKRHEEIHSAPDLRECKFCGRLVKGDEGLEKHTRRHFEQAEMYPRLEYFEGARDVYNKMTRKTGN